MQKKYESEYCDVSYIEEKNLMFVELDELPQYSIRKNENVSLFYAEVRG